jgi:hypothetical protein
MGVAARARDTSPIASFMRILPVSGPFFTGNGKVAGLVLVLFGEMAAS